MNHSLNLVGLAVNIARVYEISKFGGHSVRIIPSTTGNVSQIDCDILTNFYNLDLFADYNSPEIIVELAYSPNDIISVLNGHKYETIGDINERIATTERLTVSPKLDKVCLSLLKTAAEKLDLGINDTIQIISVAQTIANLAGNDTIKVEHLAEAIQYKSEKPTNVTTN